MTTEHEQRLLLLNEILLLNLKISKKSSTLNKSKNSLSKIHHSLSNKDLFSKDTTISLNENIMQQPIISYEDDDLTSPWKKDTFVTPVTSVSSISPDATDSPTVSTNNTPISVTEDIKKDVEEKVEGFNLDFSF